MQVESLSAYLEKNGDLLIQKIEQSAKPLVSEFVRPDVELLREPLDGQWPRAMATVEAWRNGRRGVVSSLDTGFGKTMCALTSVQVHAQAKPYRCLVVCPPHIVKKWCREVMTTIPGAKATIIEHYSDVLKLIGTKPTGPEWYIMSENKAKMGTPWRPAVTHSKADRTVGALRCPSCHTVVEKKLKEGGADIYIPAQIHDLVKKPLKCEKCNAPLWQWTHEYDRWPVANIIQHQAKHVFRYLVIDELHGAKGQLTAQGTSVGKMASAVPFVVGLTGTMMNGYADSVLPMSFRLFPGKVKSLGFKWGETKEFVTRYGRTETIQSFQDQESFANRQSKGGGRSTNSRVKPGIVPSLYGELLLENTVFGGLHDLGYELPKYDEVLHPCPMDEEQQEHYRSIESAIRIAIRPLLQSGSKAAMSLLLGTLNCWPDHPYDFPSIGYRNEEGEWIEVCSPPDLDRNVLRPKEEALIETVKDAVARGRQVWIFVEMTDKRDIQTRIQSLLEAEGLDVRVLRSKKVKPIDREEWIYDNGKANVIISNPALVKTGLDLFDRGGNHNFSELIFYQTGYNLDTLRQASGRAWRVGQWLECNVHYFYYDATMQASCVKLMSAKTNAARALEGKFSNSAFAAMTEGDESIAMALAKRLASGEAAHQELNGPVKVSIPILPKVVSSSPPKSTHRPAESIQQAFMNFVFEDELVGETSVTDTISIKTGSPRVPPVETHVKEVSTDAAITKDIARLLTYPSKIRDEIEKEWSGELVSGYASWRHTRLETQLKQLSDEQRAKFASMVDVVDLRRAVHAHVEAIQARKKEMKKTKALVEV